MQRMEYEFTIPASPACRPYVGNDKNAKNVIFRGRPSAASFIAALKRIINIYREEEDSEA